MECRQTDGRTDGFLSFIYADNAVVIWQNSLDMKTISIYHHSLTEESYD